MDILVNVVNQKLRVATNLKTLVSGSQDFVKFTFNFLDSAWNNLTVFAQFMQDGVTYSIYLDSNKSVYLPAAIQPGTCTLMLYGTGSTTIGTTNNIIFKIDDSGVVSDSSSTDITPTLYQQLVDQVVGKVNKPATSPNGTAGQLLRTNGDGTTQWVNQGTPTDAQTQAAVAAWLAAHPEATTTVQDGAITVAKLASDVKSKIVAGVVGTTLVIGVS